MASSATAMAPTTSRGMSIIAMPAVMNSPSPPPPMNAASVAPETICTAAVRMPAKITGRASGISIRRMICAAVMPCPRAASIDVGVDLAQARIGVDEDRRQP